MANQKNQYRRQFVVDPAYTTVKQFGEHPKFLHSYQAAVRYTRNHTPEQWVTRYHRPIQNFSEARHPAVYLLPRDHFYVFTDGDPYYGEVIGFEQTPIYFSSSSFYIDREANTAFHELNHPLFRRLGDIRQLEFLVPPYPTDDPNGQLIFTTPPFSHTRWIHCLIPAALAEIIIARAGFTPKERMPFVLACAFHDVALPAGGDSVKRIDPSELDEEKNFSLVLERTGLAVKWQKQYGFNLERAAGWVKNEGTLGLLLDVLDKLSYTSLDCYFLGRLYNGDVRRLGQAHPLFMDVWQDIRFTPDRQHFGFTDPERLFTFLLARAYEYQELLYNPAARYLNFHLTNLVKPLYERDEITKDQLLTWSTRDLEYKLFQHYGREVVHLPIIDASEYQWRKFKTEAELIKFQRTLGKPIDHVEFISGFNPNLDWPILIGNNVVPAGDLLDHKKVSELTKIVDSVRSHFLYWHKPTP